MAGIQVIKDRGVITHVIEDGLQWPVCAWGPASDGDGRKLSDHANCQARATHRVVWTELVGYSDYGPELCLDHATPMTEGPLTGWTKLSPISRSSLYDVHPYTTGLTTVDELPPAYQGPTQTRSTK